MLLYHTLCSTPCNTPPCNDRYWSMCKYQKAWHKCFYPRYLSPRKPWKPWEWRARLAIAVILIHMKRYSNTQKKQILTCEFTGTSYIITFIFSIFFWFSFFLLRSRIDHYVSKLQACILLYHLLILVLFYFYSYCLIAYRYCYVEIASVFLIVR